MFAVYLKAAGSYEAAKDTERDYLTCDGNGFAQSKDLPYGVYTVHQVSGWEGRELMSDFDVFIAKNGETYRYLINNANFESFIKVIKVDAETGNILHHEENVDLLPANLELSAMEMMLVTTMSRETVLRTYLNKVKNDYEYKQGLYKDIAAETGRSKMRFAFPFSAVW